MMLERKLDMRHRPNSTNNQKPRATSRVVKAHWVPTYNSAIKALIAGIDSGEVSGFSMWQCGTYIGSEVVNTAEQRERMIQIAYRRSLQLSLPLIFVAETWPSGYLPNRKRMSHKSLLGMGMNWGKWLQEIEKLPQPKNLDEIKILRVENQVWRKPHGLNKYSKDQAKKMALAICQNDIDKDIIDHNQAEATLIGAFGAFHEYK